MLKNSTSIATLPLSVNYYFWWRGKQIIIGETVLVSILWHIYDYFEENSPKYLICNESNTWAGTSPTTTKGLSCRVQTVKDNYFNHGCTQLKFYPIIRSFSWVFWFLITKYLTRMFFLYLEILQLHKKADIHVNMIFFFFNLIKRVIY